MKLRNRAKVLLTAIAVFAVVGGAMAFKAHRGSTIFVTNAVGGACNVTLPDFTITEESPGDLRFATAVSSTTCKQTLVTEQP